MITRPDFLALGRRYPRPLVADGETGGRGAGAQCDQDALSVRPVLHRVIEQINKYLAQRVVVETCLGLAVNVEFDCAIGRFRKWCKQFYDFGDEGAGVGAGKPQLRVAT